MKRIKRILWGVGLLAVLIATIVWWLQCGGVSHREIRDAVTRESHVLQTQIDERTAQLDARFDALDQQLNRIEKKLDRLILLSTPQLPDGLKEK